MNNGCFGLNGSIGSASLFTPVVLDASPNRSVGTTAIPHFARNDKARLIATLALIVLAACSKGRGEETDAAATPVVAVRMATVSEQPFTETVSAIATVTGRPGHFASLGAPT